MIEYKLPDGAEEVSAEEMIEHLEQMKKVEARRKFAQDPKNAHITNAKVSGLSNNFINDLNEVGLTKGQIRDVLIQTMDQFMEIVDPNFHEIKKEFMKIFKDTMEDLK